MTHQPDQLGFEALLSAAQAENETRRFSRQTAHLPGTIAAAISFFRVLLCQHHAAMLAANVEEAMRLREEARLVAQRLNNGEPGILADDNSPGNVLVRETAAPRETVPLWGQEGNFVVTVGAMRVRIAMDGVFGIASSTCYWPGFGAHAIDQDRLFLSETGYRSFLGIHAGPVPQITADEFARRVIESYVMQELKGKLHAIKPQYRKAEEGA